MPALALFEDHLEALHRGVMDRFVTLKRARHHVLFFQGERIRNRAQFWNECVRVMPGCASYFGRNLDALDEVLLDPGLGLAPNREPTTYWVWKSMDHLYQHDSEFAAQVFQVLLVDASQACRGAMGGSADPSTAQPVILVASGRWEVLGKVSESDLSFLHAPERAATLRTLRVQAGNSSGMSPI